MYPNLLVPLLVIVGGGSAVLLAVGARQPVSRRLAARQVVRRRSEAALVMIGSALGIAIIVGALVVGDTLNFSVRQVAYRTLGPIDERVVAPSTAVGAAAADRLAALRHDPAVDGVLTASIDQASAVHAAAGARYAVPRVLAWDVGFAAARQFGNDPAATGITGPDPAPGQVVLNQPLARSLHAAAGQQVTLLLYGRPVVLTVARVLPQKGIAGAGLGAETNDNAFLPAGLLAAQARGRGTTPLSVTFVSNRGGVEGGNKLTDLVTAAIHRDLGSLNGQVTVSSPKHDVLKEAKSTGDSLGALFLMIGSFSIIAGALLLVNIFVMLGEDRKAQLGMLRAVGMKRSWLIESFSLEGAAYAALSVAPGVAVGVGVGWAVARIAAQIFKSWSASGSGLQIAFAVTPVSLINGTLLGLLIALAAVVATSARISRFNVIAAIRDLPPAATSRPQRTALASALAVVCGVAAVPAVITSQPEQTYVLPALAAVFAVPALQRVMSKRAALSAVAAAILGWSLVASVARPRIFDTPSMAVYVVLGTLTAFSAVVLVSQNQRALLRLLRRFLQRPTEASLARRLAVSYPVAKQFRTGATLVMYTLIMLVLVLLTEITGIMNASVNRSVADATSGYTLRVDFNPKATSGTLLSGLRSGPLGSDINAVSPLTSAAGQATDPGHRTTALLSTVAVGVLPRATDGITFNKRLAGLSTDAEVWASLQRHPDEVVIDEFFGSTGGPPGQYYKPGDRFRLSDPRTGRSREVTIAGVLRNGMVFYPSGVSQTTFPVIMSATALRSLYGGDAGVTSALIRTPAKVSADDMATRLQATYLASSLVATPIATNIRHMFAANTAFFRLMQGFLALGLVVGVAGLGVVMVRAVRERRRTIGVLRALGFQARTIRRAFLDESAFIAAEGIVLGAVLGVLTTWLMYQKSSQFTGLNGGFPIEWLSIALLAVATFVASLLATAAPARRAAGIRPALAVRVAS